MDRSILIVDDEQGIREILTTAFRRRGFHTEEAADGESAISRLRQSAFDGVLCDLRMPAGDGFEVLKFARSLYPDLVFILMTGYGSTQNAVEAIKVGADDYVLKPLSVEEVALKFHKAFQEKALRDENQLLREQLRERYEMEGIVGQSRAMQDIFRLVGLIAPTSSTVLITGESGSGKELFARAIHFNSPRCDHPMLSVNCGAIPDSLLEDELFGHVKGAFTGAVQDRTGYFEAADKGTLFLDEVSSLPFEMQSKLLRVLQEREVRRLGDAHAVTVDVRIIAATNTDLQNLVTSGRFRDDLFYRLNVIPIHIPPLRERREDIPALANHFLAKVARQQSLTAKSFSQAAMRMLVSYDWPGNVRQLENAIEMACVLSGERSTLLPEDFHSVLGRRVLELQSLPDLQIPEEGIDLNRLLERLERSLIEKTLAMTEGNKNRAARLLSLKRTTLVEKLKKWERKS